jgi:ABC-type lipopolysaccharide export system ATPase subunit
MGIENIWLLDPVERVAFTYSGSGLKRVETARIEVGGTPIYMDLDEVFAGLE